MEKDTKADRPAGNYPAGLRRPVVHLAKRSREEDGDEMCTPLPPEDKGLSPGCRPSELQHVPTAGEMIQDGDSSRSQICTACKRNMGRSPRVDSLVVDLGCPPLSRLDRFRKNAEEILSRASLKWSDSTNLFQFVHNVLGDKGISYHDKFQEITWKITESIGVQQDTGHAGINNLALEAQFELAHLEHECHSLQELTSSLQKELHATRSVSLREKEQWQKTVADLRAEIIRIQVRLDLIAEKEATAAGQKVCCREVECGFRSSLKQMTHVELLDKVPSLHETSRLVEQELREELQKISQVPEPSAKSDPPEAHASEQSFPIDRETGVKYQPGEADEEQLLRPLSGSYSDESATPNLLVRAICNAKDELTRFHKTFFDALKKKSAKVKQKGILDPGMFFARTNHVSFYVQSIVNDVLFEGFENESFQTLSGVSKFPNPNRRQTMFYKCYKDNAESAELIDVDAQFKGFAEAKASALWKLIEDNDGDGMKVCSFQELGGSSKSRAKLTFLFRAALRSMWLLHKLSFSFEPPACAFGVTEGADVDPAYTAAVSSVEGNPNFVSKVGFMVTPGLRLRNSVMSRCEVYLAAQLDVKHRVKSRVKADARKSRTKVVYGS